MGKRWIVVGLIVLVILGVTGWYMWNVGSGTPLRAVLTERVIKLSQEAKNTTPAELAEAFDPTVNTATFVIQAMDNVRDTWTMDMVWPESAARQVESKLVCEGGQIRLKSKNKEEVVDISRLREKLNEGGPRSIMLSGRCSDRECTQVVGKCRATWVGRQE
jgi:hypothetical protein